MYKVLLVDDERIILDGISQMVDWPAYHTALIATASSGVEAYECILKHSPDIVISDIRMPGMDGLELIAKTYETHPHIKFILLSGYREFEYASQAMHYGVKHYLLKPTNELKIGESINELVEELDRNVKRTAFMNGVKEQLDKMMPHVKEQILKEFVTNKMYGKRDWEYYRNLFQYDTDQPVSLLLFQLEGEADFEHLFAIKNIAEELLSSTLLATTLGSHVLILIQDPERIADMHQRIDNIRHTFRNYYKMDVTIAQSSIGHIYQARALYQETLQCLNYRFYLDEGGLITQHDTSSMPTDRVADFEFDEDRLLMPVRSGHLKDAEKALDDFFGRLKLAQLDIASAKSYAIGQYVSLIRLADARLMDEYYYKIPSLVAMNSLQAIQAELAETVQAITLTRYEQTTVKYIAFVRQTIEIIHANIGNPDLSLTFVAGQLVFINPDYLGKLFKKETGEKFTSYVMKLRIQKATEWIASDPDIKIFELADRLGYGDNPQYFSQVFKKYMGCTPTEYMKY